MFKTREIPSNDFLRQEFPDPALIANVGSPHFQPGNLPQVASAVPVPDAASASVVAAAMDSVETFLATFTLHPLVAGAIAVAAVVLAGLHVAHTLRTSARSGFPPSLARR